jgi:hypothetical protein
MDQELVRLAGADKSVNRTLEAKARAVAGLKGYDAARLGRNPTVSAASAEGAEQVGGRELTFGRQQP